MERGGRGTVQADGLASRMRPWEVAAHISRLHSRDVVGRDGTLRASYID